MFKSLNPYSQEIAYLSEYHTDIQIEEALHLLHKGYLSAKSTKLEEKKLWLLKIISVLEQDINRFATLITQEVGKPLKESIAEVNKCKSLCEHYAENLELYLGEKNISLAPDFSIVQKGSGVVLGIMPWNFPFWQVFRLAVPTILVGNTVLLKHAPNTPLCALQIENIFTEASPDISLYKNCFADLISIPKIIADFRVKGVSLTGSERAGRSVYQIAAQYLKPVVLELGSNDPFIVFKDADIQTAASEAVLHRLRNTGQSCIAPKRILVHEDVQKSFLDKVFDVFYSLKMGNPMENHDMGTLARHDLVVQAQNQVEATLMEGAILQASINAPTESTCFFPAYIISDVRPGMPLFDEEVFAPVVAISTFKNLEDAISLANHSNYGLGASVWTQDVAIFETMIQHLEYGLIYQNEAVYSNAAVPFGGVKNSGIGKELGEDGFRAFSNRVSIFKAKV